MICTSCGNAVDAVTNKCTYCGKLQNTVISPVNNSASYLDDTSVTHPAIPTYNSISKKLHRSKRVFTIIALVLVVFLALFGGLVFSQNANGKSHLNNAQTLVSKSDYKGASAELNKVSMIFIFGGLKFNIQDLKKKVTPWAEYQTKLELAQQYFDQGKYDEAGGLLNQIGSDFPGKSQVMALSSKINSQAVIVKKIEQDIPKVSTHLVAPTTSAPATALTMPVVINSGTKRFTSTEAQKSLAKASTVEQAGVAIQTFLKQYDLVLRFEQSTESDYAKSYSSFTTLTETDLGALKSYGSLFIDEWAKYPVSWVKASQLKDIYLVKNLKISGTTRAAMPDPFGDAVFYDVYYTDDYAKEVLHHEYNHLITYNLFGQFNPSDSVWLAYNPVNFTYGNGGASCYQPTNTCLTGSHPIPGFVTGYAASDIAEDKAEVYGYLMSTSNYHNLNSWIVSDKALASKVNNYKQFMASKSPEMSGTYFDDINP